MKNKYILTSLNVNEAAHAMINGKEFFNSNGEVTYFWNGSSFLSLHQNAGTAHFEVDAAKLYEKIKVEWWEVQERFPILVTAKSGEILELTYKELKERQNKGGFDDIKPLSVKDLELYLEAAPR